MSATTPSPARPHLHCRQNPPIKILIEPFLDSSNYLQTTRLPPTSSVFEILKSLNSPTLGLHSFHFCPSSIRNCQPNDFTYNWSRRIWSFFEGAFDIPRRNTHTFNTYLHLWWRNGSRIIERISWQYFEWGAGRNGKCIKFPNWLSLPALEGRQIIKVVRWTPPKPGTKLLTTDIAVGSEGMAIGAILRDGNGAFICGLCQEIKAENPSRGEMRAAEIGLNWALQFSRNISHHMDFSMSISNGRNPSEDDEIIQSIQRLASSANVNFMHI